MSLDNYLDGFEFGLEKDYTLIKTKENEDNIERKRLKTENKLLRQRIERLEEETLTLADRLVQDQVKYGNQEEELYTLRRKLSLSLQRDAVVTTNTASSPDVIATDGSTPDAKELQSRIDELVNREVSHLAEMHDLKMRISELEKKNLESQASDVTDLQQQLVLSKLREAEMNISAKELEQRVLELDKYCQKHQELMNFGENKPKVQKAKIQVLTEELMSGKLKETNLSKELMELKLKTVDLETKNHVNERLIRKLEEEKEALRESLSKYESNKITWDDEMRCLKRQLSGAESKQQNDDLMTKIKDAETSQAFAELKQKIAQLEIQNQELLTAEKLYKGATQGDNVTDIDAKIEELHQQIIILREKKKLHQSFCSQNGKQGLESLTRNYSIESLSDMEDFDAVRYKLKGSMSSISKLENGKESNPDLHDDAQKREESITSESSISLDGFVHQSSSDSDYCKEDILAGCFDRQDREKRTSSNPDIILDSVFNDSESGDLQSSFSPVLQSSPANSRNSCSFIKRLEVDQLPFKNLKTDVPCKFTLAVSLLEDPDKTPTNEIGHDSRISDHFVFEREANVESPVHQNNAKISAETFPDILSDPNTLNEIVRNNMSSLIAGLDLPGDKSLNSEDKGSKPSDARVASDRNLSLSLDILSAV